MTVDLDLRVDELVVAGFGSVDGQRLGRAVERELARLLSERGIPSGLGRSQAVAHVVAPPIELPAAAGPEAIAARVARAIYEGLGR